MNFIPEILFIMQNSICNNDNVDPLLRVMFFVTEIS